jgi:hypothetical protein
MNHLGGFGFGVSNTRSGTERSNQMRLQTTFTMHFELSVSARCKFHLRLVFGTISVDEAGEILQKTASRLFWDNPSAAV